MIATSLAAALVIVAPTPQDYSSGPTPYSAVSQTPSYSGATFGSQVLNAQDAALFRQGLAAARARDIAGTQSVMAQIADPTARKLVEWALIDTSGERLSYTELAQAQTSMAGWPRGDSRQQAAEKVLDRSGLGADAALALFADSQPTTAEGAIALASAYEQRGRVDQARALIRDWWTTRSFDEPQQTRILGRWGSWLTPADHEARLNMLLLGPHGPATQAMIGLVSPERAAIANTVMALRTAYSPDAMVASLSPAQAADPAVALERVRILRSQSRQSEAFPLLANLPPAPTHKAGQDTLWTERRNYFLDALQLGNWRAAYDAMNGHGFTSGDRMVDAEFFAGWVALTKLNQPEVAARHFETLRGASSTPITQGRAYYWLGRAAEARGERDAAMNYYRNGAQHWQTFYGQLSAEKAGMTTLTLPAEPAPDQGAIDRFERNELVRASRILGETGETSLLRVFAYQLDDQLPTIEDLALLMDLARGYGEGFTAMMVGRAASQRGFVLPERMYPVRVPPQVAGAAPLPFTLAITRQESSFDPRVVSSAGARGMMQFLPSTAQGVARRLGMGYSADQLWDPDYNMTLGSYHLGELMAANGGSMLLATVGYNAGPARPSQWVARCGDPRGDATRTLDFIECAPFTETRNYMMRVMENMAVYKARLNGGTAPLTPSADIAAGAAAGPRPYAAY